MEHGEFFQEAFRAAIISAGARARLETLKAGVAVFYWDWKQNLDVIEQPDGRKFEVRFRTLDGAIRGGALQECSIIISANAVYQGAVLRS